MKTWILGVVGACSLAWLSSGTEAWQATIHGIVNSPEDSAQAVAVDAAGNIVAVGSPKLPTPLRRSRRSNSMGLPGPSAGAR